MSETYSKTEIIEFLKTKNLNFDGINLTKDFYTVEETKSIVDLATAYTVTTNNGVTLVSETVEEPKSNLFRKVMFEDWTPAPKNKPTGSSKLKELLITVLVLFLGAVIFTSENVGETIGGLVLFAVLGGGIYFWFKYRKKR